jgi:3-oxoacyl-[acyl-carrier protein] reductase
MELSGKTAIVTGAGSGFGRAISARFAAQGASVVVADINEAAASSVAAELTSAGFKAVATRIDVASDADVKATAELAVSRFGRIDIVINNAGYTHARSKPEDVTEADFDRVFAVNVKSIFLFVRHVSPTMKKQKSGVVINIASTAARRPSGALTWYGASKGAVVTATQSLAVDLGQHGVRVNAISPVIGETALLTRFTGTEDTPEARRRFTASIPLGRYCKPDDVAEAALFLASDRGSYITGATLDVDGGFLCGNYIRAD